MILCRRGRMNKRGVVAIISIVSIAFFLIIGLPLTQVRANHCHPEHTTKKSTTAPTPMKKSAVRTKSPNLGRQHTFTRIPKPIPKPVRSSASSFENTIVESETLGFNEIYSRDFPMAIVSISKAVKAIQSGDRQTELAELSKALDKLMTVYKVMEIQGKNHFINSLQCPIMGSPINIKMVDENLTREYKGQKVAFCCAGCPSAWDKLNNAEKHSKVPGLKL
jgi:hypothetical protein